LTGVGKRSYSECRSIAYFHTPTHGPDTKSHLIVVVLTFQERSRPPKRSGAKAPMQWVEFVRKNDLFDQYYKVRKCNLIVMKV